MLGKMKTRRVVAIALAAVMALSTPMMSFAETSGEEIVEEVVQETVAEEIAQEPVATDVTEEPVIEEVAQEPATEDVITPSEPEIIEISSPSEDAEEDEEIVATPSEIILEDTAEDGMKVTLKADSDAFEYNEGLSLDVSVVSDEEAKEADEELESETKNDNIAKRVTYDIKVMHGDEELEPLEGKKVKVEFTVADIPSGADAVNVYHIDEEDGVETIIENAPVNEATGSEAAVSGDSTEDAVVITSETVAEKKDADEVEEEDIFEDGDIVDDVTVEGETDSFSLYTVDFTYEEKTVSIPGDTTENLLSDILADVGIEGVISEVKAYQDASCSELVENGEVKDGDKVLFKVYQIENEWYMDAVNAFDTEHGLVVKTADGAEYRIKVTDDAAKDNLLTLTALQTDATITFEYETGSGVEYATNSNAWTECPSGTVIILENTDDYVKFKGTDVTTTEDKHFSIAGYVAASGDVTSLTNGVGGDVALTEGCYKSMFSYCTGLVTPPVLPSTTLAENCYKSMFDYCQSLKTAPVLPASSLPAGCYCNMFYKCTSLEKVPSLLATELNADCCCQMFAGCTSLSVKEGEAGEKGSFTCAGSYQKSEVEDMFSNTGGSFRGTPKNGYTYYFPAPEFTVNLDSGTEAKTKGTESVQVTYGNPMPELESLPTRTDGHPFIGYYDAVSGGNKYYAPNGTSAKSWDKYTDTTLYAQWTTATIWDVEFDVQGCGTAPKTQKVLNGEKAIKPADPAVEGYFVSGWYKEAEYINEWNFNIEKVYDNVKLYAKWEKIEPVKYIDENGREQTCVSYVPITDSKTRINLGRLNETRWYVVDGTVTLEFGARCFGNVRIILKDGCELIAKGNSSCAGIAVGGSNSLAIYGQSGQSGKLTATANGSTSSRTGAAAIGGSNEEGCTLDGGNITINGGIISARNEGYYGAGIGGTTIGGSSGNGYNITINGGSVEAKGGMDAAAIGGCKDSSGYNITINGGYVKAQGSYGGAGIGGGYNGLGSDITINGGEIDAYGGSSGAGIGGGQNGKATNITINGGKIDARGGNIVSGIGSGQNGAAPSNIIAALGVQVKAGSESASSVIKYSSAGETDISGRLNSGTRYMEISTTKYVAQIGDTKYKTVQDAINAATPSQTVKVQMLNSSEESITIGSGKTIILDLNGNVLSAPKNKRVILNQGDLTIIDSNKDAPHYFIYYKNSAWVLDTTLSSGINVDDITSETENGTSIKVPGGIICDGNATDNGGAISMQKDGGDVTTTFTGGSIVGCQAKCGAAIYRNEGKLNLNGGNIYGCKASESGGAVESFANNGQNAAVSFSAGNIQYCSSPIGGGIYNKEYSKLEMSGTAKIATCSSSNIGGGVCTNGSFEMNGGYIQGCSADKGGGVFVNNQDTAAFVMKGGSVTKNNAATRSGGVEVKGKITLGDSASVTGNTLGQGADIKDSNIYLNGTGKTITINEGFSGSAGVGVSVTLASGSSVAITGTNNDDYSSRFPSDDRNCTIIYVPDTQGSGHLAIRKNTDPIIITASSSSAVYNGASLSNATYTYTDGILKQGDKLTATVEGSVKDVGTAANKVTEYKVMRGDVDVTNEYTFGDTVDGELKITKRSVTITSGSASKTYDGTPLENKATPAETGDRFVSGEGAIYKVTGSKTYVGQSTNKFDYTLKSNTKADNYDIKTVQGVLTVEKVTTPIIVTAASCTAKYDGASLSNAGYTYTGGILVTGDALTATVEGSVKDVGTAANKVTEYKVMRKGVDVTYCYTFGDTVDGELKVTKRSVTITSGSASKTYDGTPLENKATPAETRDRFVSGEGVIYTVTGSITNVGTAKNTFDYTAKAGTKLSNYNITKVEGTLTVNSKPSGGGSSSGGGGGSVSASSGSGITGAKAATTPITVAADGTQVMGTAIASKPLSMFTADEQRNIYGKSGQTAWVVSNGHYQLKDATGNLIKNQWAWVSDNLSSSGIGNVSKFYFDENGYMVIGSQWIKDADGIYRQYFFNDENGSLLGSCLMGGTKDDKILNENGQITGYVTKPAT